MLGEGGLRIRTSLVLDLHVQVLFAEIRDPELRRDVRSAEVSLNARVNPSSYGGI